MWVDLEADGVNAWLLDGAGTWIETAKLSSVESIDGSWVTDDIRGSSADEFLNGGGGNDTLQGRGGVNFIDGGDGMDTAVYAGNQSDFGIYTQENGTVVVTSNGPDIISDNLVNVEVLRFFDGDLIL